MASAEKKVVLYVVPNCPLCSNARTWLNSNGIDFEERDVAADFGARRKMFALTHQKLVPVVEVDGRAMVRPEEHQLRSLLDDGQ
ncbi:MAG TPA: glutaredoxin family protein [Candidatus Obscuribacterales bacterium]